MLFVVRLITDIWCIFYFHKDSPIQYVVLPVVFSRLIFLLTIPLTEWDNAHALKYAMLFVVRLVRDIWCISGVFVTHTYDSPAEYLVIIVFFFSRLLFPFNSSLNRVGQCPCS